MRDFEQDRKICEAASKGPWHAYYGYKNKHVLGGPDYIPVASGKDLKDEDATFIAAAREGWPAALDRIEALELEVMMLKLIANDRQRLDEQLDAAAEMRFKDAADNPEQICFKCERYEDNSCPQERAFCVGHWRDYWRRKRGSFQNGNNHGTTSKMETVGEGAE